MYFFTINGIEITTMYCSIVSRTHALAIYKGFCRGKMLAKAKQTPYIYAVLSKDKAEPPIWEKCRKVRLLLTWIRRLPSTTTQKNVPGPTRSTSTASACVRLYNISKMHTFPVLAPEKKEWPSLRELLLSSCKESPEKIIIWGFNGAMLYQPSYEENRTSSYI